MKDVKIEVWFHGRIYKKLGWDLRLKYARLKPDSRNLRVNNAKKHIWRQRPGPRHCASKVHLEIQGDAATFIPTRIAPMARLSTSTPLWRLSIASLLLTILIPANALYFYIDGESPRCFHEELPKDTMVVGT